MDIAFIDQLSNNGKGWLNKTSIISKIVLTISLIFSIIVADRYFELLFIFVLIILLNISNLMPVMKILKFAMYPAFFSLIFALARFYYSFEGGIVIIFKAVDAALTMILLITTTPYTRLFSFFKLFLPNILVDAMLFTYRIFFVLLDKISHSLTIMRIRGGFRPSNILFNVRNLTGVIGVLFINAFDMSERMYVIYSLRGYEGSIKLENDFIRLRVIDFIPIVISIIVIILAVIM